MMKAKITPLSPYLNREKTRDSGQGIGMTLEQLAVFARSNGATLSRQLNRRRPAIPGYADRIEDALGCARGSLR